jgi:hypothetical protein
MNQTIKSGSSKVGGKWRDGDGNESFPGDACYFVELGSKERARDGEKWRKSGKAV